ncbi:MAG TPA: hypothetical protein PKU78_06725, partial [Candidatus Dojkabacteria bacterium]|nr:hypothetical protein [Candidatus Dojkabacteria bacterium]
MFEKTNVLLVPFEVKNLNGRIYRKESFPSLKETYGIDCLDPAVYDIPYNGVQISNTCGIVENVVFSPDGIVGDVRLIDHPFGLAIEPMFRDDLVV